jgi:hypothetical protein
MTNMTEFYASILENVREEAKKEERERILQWIADNDSGRCCFESHDLVAFMNGENK